MRRALATTVAAAALGLGCASAEAAVNLSASAAGERGTIMLYVQASADVAAVSLTERGQPVALVPLAFLDHPEIGPMRFARVQLPWRCDRLARSFAVAGRSADGEVQSAVSAVRTPSCRTRLALAAPARARPGRRVALRVRDTWAADPIDADLCVRPPGAAPRCRTVRAGGPAGHVRVHRRGRWRVTVRGPDQRIVHELAVGVPERDGATADARVPVLVTGDSMMQNVDTVLDDRLGRRARVTSDIRIATGLSRPGSSWARAARAQVARLAPAATVLMLGVNDGYPMRTAACCGDPWVAEYARRARALMRIYAQGGAGAVTWLTVPAARDPGRSAVYAAINSALERAARDVPGVLLLRADAILTPAGVYRDDMEVDGRRSRVRATDGIHLSIAGARVLATAIVRHLATSGVLPR